MGLGLANRLGNANLVEAKGNMVEELSSVQANYSGSIERVERVSRLIDSNRPY